MLTSLALDPAVTALAAAAGALPPTFTGDDDCADTALFTAMRICTGTGSMAPVATAPVASADPTTPTASSLLKRAAPVFIHQRATAISTARWVSALMSDWDHNVRQGTFTSDHPGYRLADAMATYVSAIFSQRRHLLANDDAYRARSRDPVQAALSSVSASARPQFNLVSCSLSVPLPLAHSRPDASPDSTALPTSLRT
jgi:hypothetical protein